MRADSLTWRRWSGRPFGSSSLSSSRAQSLYLPTSYRPTTRCSSSSSLSRSEAAAGAGAGPPGAAGGVWAVLRRAVRSTAHAAACFDFLGRANAIRAPAAPGQSGLPFCEGSPGSQPDIKRFRLLRAALGRDQVTLTAQGGLLHRELLLERD